MLSTTKGDGASMSADGDEDRNSAEDVAAPAPLATDEPASTDTGAPNLAQDLEALLRDVLLLEDDVIISLDAEGMLYELGAARVRAARTEAEALAMIDEDLPTFAFLDVNLGGRTSYEVATRLRAAQCPFIFASGYSNSPEFTRTHGSVPTVRKPYGLPNIKAAVEACLGRNASGEPAGPKVPPASESET